MSQILNGEINLKDRMTNTLNKVNSTLHRMYSNMPNVVGGMNSAFTKIENRIKNFNSNVQNAEQNRYKGMMQNHQKFINYLHKTPGEIDRANAKIAAKTRSFAMHQQNISMGLGVAGVPAGYAVYKSGRMYADFDKMMADLRSKTLDDRSLDYRNQAIKLGMQTKFSASEVAQAQVVLAKAGFMGNKLLSATPAAVNLAASNDMSMEDAAKAIIAAKSTFGLGDSLKDLNKIVDMLSYTANNTQADVNGLIKAMVYSGNTADRFGLKLEEHLFLSGKLKDYGFADSTTGTSLNQFLEQMLSNKKARKTLDKLKVSLYETGSDGKMKRRNFFDILPEIQTALKNSRLDVADVLGHDLAGTRGGRAMGSLMKMDPEEFQKQMKQFTDPKNYTNYAERMAIERMRSILGVIERITSAYESLSIIIGDMLVRHGFYKWIENVADKFGKLIDIFMIFDRASSNNLLSVKQYQVEMDKMNSIWIDGADFVRGFREGTEQVIDFYKTLYKNVSQFLTGVSGKSPEDFGKFVAKFIGFTAGLGPLALVMLFVKNITMGLYSTFGMLASVLSHSGHVLGLFFQKLSEGTKEVKTKALSRKQVMAQYANYFDPSTTTTAHSSKGGSILPFGGTTVNEKYTNPAQDILDDINKKVAASKMVGVPVTAQQASGATNQISGLGFPVIKDTAIGGPKSAIGGREKANSLRNRKFANAKSRKFLGLVSALDPNEGMKNSFIPNILGKSGIDAEDLVRNAGAFESINGLEAVTGRSSSSTKHSKFANSGFLGSSSVNDLDSTPYGKKGRMAKMKDLLKKGAKKSGEGLLSQMTFGHKGSANFLGNLISGGAELASMMPLAGATFLERNVEKSPAPSKYAKTDAFGNQEKGHVARERHYNERKAAFKGKMKGGMMNMVQDFTDQILTFGKSILGFFSGIISTVFSPIGLAIGAIAVIIMALLSGMKKEGESWGELFSRVFNNIIALGKMLWETVLVPLGQGIAEAFGPTFKMINERFSAMWERMKPAIERLQAMFSSDKPGGIGTSFKEIGKIAGQVFDFILMPSINMIITAVEVLFGLLTDVAEIFTSIMSGDWTGLAKSVLRFFIRIITGISQLLATAIGNILQRLPFPGMRGAGADLIDWSTKNLDAEKITNSLWTNNLWDLGKTGADKAVEMSKIKDKYAAMYENKSTEGGKFFETPDPNALKKANDESYHKFMQQVQERTNDPNQSKATEEQLKVLKEINENTAKDCDTTLDGTRVKKNQERWSSIKRQQGSGRYALRNSKTQGLG